LIACALLFVTGNDVHVYAHIISKGWLRELGVVARGRRRLREWEAIPDRTHAEGLNGIESGDVRSHAGQEYFMLILTRRVGETVMIGNEVTVTVLGVKGNQVRVGVNAPRDVAVHREEIFERIKREEQDGGGTTSARADGVRSNGNGHAANGMDNEPYP